MRNLLCVLSLFVTLTSCGTKNSESANSANPGLAASSESKAEEAPPERRLIRNGSMSFEVDDVTTTRQKISLLVSEAGGYVFSEKRHADDERPSHEQVVRIPGGQFEAFISKVEGLAKSIDGEDFTSDDVTEQYVDLETRLVAKKELEARFREIVKQAKTIKEILEVEEQIGYVHSEIEQLQGKLKYLSNKTSFSTISLTYYQPALPIELPGTGTKFIESFLGGWRALVALLIGLTSIWPFLIAVSAATWFVIRRRRKEVRTVIQ